ncbi:cell division protein FtsA [uncultured Bacteroides sp.]|uniref:cell division protein FtsA n=1 Tax=uncultured Bacteroides sp. TaxID=162156 RepID=UPI0025ED62F8|nr:cell division protein FtsA [uncultured Bacteroides sp.]
MATTEFIAAIELGSSKITGVAGKKNSDGSMQVLAYAQEDSSTFIRKGVIFNLDKTAQSLTSIINRLEGELKNSIAKVYVGIGGQSLRTVRNVVSRDLEDEAIISEELVSAIGDENIAVPVVDMDILDVAPQEYKVGNNLQANPVGLVGSHIEGRFLNIVARTSVRKNLEHCFEQAKIDIADQLIAPLVTANAVLTESERRSGCALIDFGADTTTISVYKNNILRFLTVLPLGGNSITRDITSLKIEEEEAERLKKTYGDALYEEDPEQEEPTCELDDDNRTLKVSELNNIVEARAEEIIANVWNQVQLSGYEDKLLAGIIMTGGAANLRSLDEILRKRSKIEKIRIAKLPRNTVHASNNVLKKDGSQNTLFGLLFEGNQNCCLVETAPQTPATPKPEPEVQSANIFDNDPEYQEQTRIARQKKEEEEREARVAAKEAAKEKERLRKIKEKEDKERRKREAGPGWFKIKMKKTIEEMTNIFNEDDEMK